MTPIFITLDGKRFNVSNITTYDQESDVHCRVHVTSGISYRVVATVEQVDAAIREAVGGKQSRC